MRNLLVCSLIFMLSSAGHAAENSCHVRQQIRLKGTGNDNKSYFYDKSIVEIGGIIEFNRSIYVISDKKSKVIQIFNPTEDSDTYIQSSNEIMIEAGCGYPDFEGMALYGDENPPSLYVIGSNSVARRRLQPTSNPADSLTEPRCDGKLFQIHINDDGKPTATKTVTVKEILGGVSTGMTQRNHIEIFDLNGDKIKSEPALLLPFTYIPAKENGMDIEGIAATNTRLYIGFRGPVLKSYYTPIFIADRNKWNEAGEILFLNLGGLGIRDLTYVAAVDKFLIIAGPVGEQKQPFHIFEWNGAATEAGSGLKRICEVEGNPEGIFIRSAKKTDRAIQFDVLIAHDNEDELSDNPRPFKVEHMEIISSR